MTQDFELGKYRHLNVVLKYGRRPILQNDNPEAAISRAAKAS